VALPTEVTSPVIFALVVTVEAVDAVAAFPVILVWSPVLVPLTVASEETVNVLDVVPPAMVKPVVAAVGVNPLIVLPVNASAPANVAKVPVVGKVTVVAAVEVSVVWYAPPVVKFPPRVIVFPVLATPVPPLAPATMPVTLAAVPVTLV